MPKLAAALDFNQLEARNLQAHQVGGPPATPVKGQVYYNTGNDTLFWWDGSAWVSARGGVSAVPPATTGALGTIQLAGDLAGTATSPQIAAGVITDADVNAANKDGAVGTPSMRTLGYSATQAMNGAASIAAIATANLAAVPIQANSQRIINLGDPTAASDATHKGYVDSVIATTWKTACRVVTDNAIALSGTQTIDDVAVAVGDRVLVKNQSLGSANGIYVVAAGAWTRALDADSWPKFVGAVVYVAEGTAYGDTLFRSSADKGGTLGTTGLVWWILPSKIATGQGYGNVMAGYHSLGSISVANPTFQDVSVSGYKLTDLAAPTAGSDASTKAYVDNAITGLDVKNSVKAASTGTINLSGGPQTVDGVAVVQGDRVLVKDQPSAAPNGIYVVGVGTWTRATDADVYAELVNAFVFVEQGTVNADSGWVCTGDQGGSIGTTNIEWVQFAGSGAVTAGGGLQKNGNQISVAANGITNAMIADGAINLGSPDVIGTTPVANGGTGATTGTGARIALAAAFSYTFTGPPATGVTWDIDVAAFTSFSRGCIVQVSDAATGVVELPDVTLSTPNATGIRIGFGAPVTLNTKRVTILGATS